MTTQTVPKFWWPDWGMKHGHHGTSTTVTAQAAVTLDAVNEQAAIVFSCPAGTSLTDIAVRTQVVSVTAGPLNFDFRLETLTNGRPSGTLFGTNTNATVAVANTDDNVWKVATLTSAATVARGDDMAVVVKAPGAGTFGFTWGGFIHDFPIGSMYPALIADIAAADGTYDTLATSVAPSVALKISGAWYRIEPLMPLHSLTQTSYSSSTNPDERALRVSVPVPMRVIGIAAQLNNIAAGGDFTFTLWPDSASSQSDSDALAQMALDGDSVGSTTIDGWVIQYFPTAVTLSANTVYWAGVRADTANAIVLTEVGVDTTNLSGIMAAMPGGSNCYMGTRQWTAGSASAFSTDTASVPLIALIVDGLDDGAGSGGLAMPVSGSICA